MGRPFPNPGNIIYNGFTFPSAVQTNVRIIPVLTSDGRTIKYREYYLHIECIVVSDDFTSGTPNSNALGINLPPSSPVDVAMQVVRRRLEVNGKPLQWTNIGIGPDLTISAAGILSPPVGGVNGLYPDVAWGPKVLGFNWTSAGSNLAALISWDCVITLACEETFNQSPTNSLNAFGEFCYGITFSIDDRGLTTRYIQGSAETAVYRIANNAISNTADNLRPLIRFPLLQGFKRQQSFPISPDKRRLDFLITDTEIPSENPYFPGCVNMDVRHRMASGIGVGGAGGFLLWQNSLSGSIELAPGVARSVAWIAFLVIFQDRISQLGTAIDNAGAPAGLTYITRIELEESIFTRQFNFSISWGMTANLATLLKASGIWRPVPGSWSDWIKSMGADLNNQNMPVAQSVYGPLGVAALRHTPQDDVIVDFCLPFSPDNPANYVPVKQSAIYQALQMPCPPPQESSWVSYKYWFDFARTTSTVVHRMIGTADATNPTNFSAGNPASEPSYNIQNSQVTPNIVQAQGASLTEVTLSGYAVRIGNKISPPNLLGIGNNPAVLKQDNVTPNALIGYTGDCPIYAIRWKRTYHVYDPSGVINVDGIPARFNDTQPV